MRPRYERPRDLVNESKVAERMAQRGIELRKLPISYRLDFAMFRDGKLRGFAEVKTRNNRHDSYPTLIISLGKVMAARQLAEISGTRSVLLVKFLDEIVWCNFATPFEVTMGGRWDRGDDDDVEPVAHFPIEAFKMV